jgi:trehalose synthase-fused probable maltokinase
MTPRPHQEWFQRFRAALDVDSGRPLIAFLERQRWFGGKGRMMNAAHVTDAIALNPDRPRAWLVLATVDYAGGDAERYAMPLLIRSAIGLEDPEALAPWNTPSGSEWICDATHDQNMWMALFDTVAQEQTVVGEQGCLKGRALSQAQEGSSGPPREAKVISGEQSNTSVVFDERAILKLVRKIEAGINPDSEMLEFLTTHTTGALAPPLLGLLTYEAGAAEASGRSTVALLQQFLPRTVDGWHYTQAHLKHLLAEFGAGKHGEWGAEAANDSIAAFREDMRTLGAVTGELHLALASQQEPASFRPEPITPADVDQWQAHIRQLLASVCRDLRGLLPSQRVSLQLTDAEIARLEATCPAWCDALRSLPRTGVCKIRHHGDFHLGQVLKSGSGFAVIDFEGEPARSLEARRAKVCPLKDVAGMLRSFGYAAQAPMMAQGRPSAEAADWLERWEGAIRTAFLDGYRSTAIPGKALFLPPTWEECARIIHVYEVDKVLYEIQYELRNRPDWLAIPLTGLRRLCRAMAAHA